MMKIYRAFRRFILALLLATTLFVSQMAMPAQANEQSELPNLFTTVVENDLLSDRETAQLDVYRSDPTTADIAIVKVQSDLLKNADGVNLNLFTGQDVPLDSIRVEERTPDNYSWFGRNSKTGDEAILVVQKNAIVGTIRTGNQKYRIRPLDDGLQAVIQIDEKAFPREHPPEFQELESQVDKQVNLEQARKDVKNNGLQDDGSIETLLVGYTPAAKLQAGNIDGLIQLAMDETNQSYANSKVYPRLRLVHSYETTYTESGDMALDRDRFRIRNDGFMDEVHNLRNTYGADIAILITGNGSFCGIASAILANQDTAFAVVGQNCATGNYSFGHEIGHLQGARHNPEADATNTPFPFGHGYYYQPGSWRTIMAYDCPGGCTRRQYWSNPNVEFNNVAMGTADSNYNVRVLNETAYTLANFRTTALGTKNPLYQLHSDGWIWQYTGTPCSGNSCPGWQRLDNNSKTKAITASGNQLYQLHNDGWIWQYTGTPCSGDSCPGWQRLDNNPKTVAIATAGGQLYQLHNDGWIWRYTGTPCNGNSCPGWQRLDNNPNTKAIAAAGGQLFQLHSNGQIWRYRGTPCNGNSCPGWQRLDNNPKTKAIAAAGDQLYQLHNDGRIWRYTGTPCNGNSCPGWQRLDNNPKTKAIAGAGGQLFQLHNDGWIWRYTGTPCNGNSCPGWQRLDNNSKTVAIAAAGDQLYQLHNDGWIWRYTGTPCSGNSCPGWERLDNNSKTKAIAAAEGQF